MEPREGAAELVERVGIRRRLAVLAREHHHVEDGARIARSQVPDGLPDEPLPPIAVNGIAHLSASGDPQAHASGRSGAFGCCCPRLGEDDKVSRVVLRPTSLTREELRTSAKARGAGQPKGAITRRPSGHFEAVATAMR